MILLLKILCKILLCDIFIFIFMGYNGRKIKNFKYFELKIMKIIFKNLKFICTILNCNYILAFMKELEKIWCNESTYINILIILSQI